jgi:3'-phosphoadenosine 5'-phosphosulfate sulfotransferase (PAPS reductase)/FAD synthetase
MTVNYCGQSSGKDSQATALWLIHSSGVSRESIRFTFCDTGNEHQFTYDHIALLSERFVSWGCAPIVTLKPERDFMELARWKKRFPSRKARFCTQFLKVIPSRADVMALLREGHEVIVHSGVRAAESADRAKLIDRGFDDMFSCVVNRPLLRWTLEEVLALSARHGVPLNPLYAYGAQRVGCFPCINSRKSEIKLISINFPDRIDQIREQERAIETGVLHSFFARKTVPPRFRTHGYENRKGEHFQVCSIDDVVRWSHTGHRAKEQEPRLFDDEGLVCPSGAGMCE